MGGMTKAVGSGWAKLKIEAAAAEKQARIGLRRRRHRGRQQVQAEDRGQGRHPRDRQRLRARLADRRGSTRSRHRADNAAVAAALDALTHAAETKTGNLARSLDPGGAPARDGGRGLRRAREDLRAPPRRHPEGDRCVRSRLRTAPKVGNNCKARSRAFADEHGRRPRVMIAKLGQDGHDRGAKVVATAFADLGFDVDIGPLFQTPQECARQAIENDVHALGVSTLAAGHKTLVPGHHRGAQGAGRGRHHRVRRRRDPRAGLRLPVRGRRQGRLRTRHADSRQPRRTCSNRSASRSRPDPRRCLLPTDPASLATALLGADAPARRRALAKAITLIESTRDDHRAQADTLLDALLPHSGKALRLGISGVPGVGKSTFIEALGLYLVAKGHRVAVLAVDPSSSVSGGSILGDKSAHGAAVGARARVHPAEPVGGHAGRRHREDARGAAGVRGGGARHRDRRDGGRRPERDRRRRHDRHVRAAAVAQRRRRPAGDQERRDGAGRPRGHQQGRLGPRPPPPALVPRSPRRCGCWAIRTTTAGAPRGGRRCCS